ncbi:hypothetical protein ACFL0R_06815 [Pseudomonadota bacterium]
MGMIYQRFCLALLLFTMACFIGAVHAADGKATDQERMGLVSRLEQSLKGYEVNLLEKHYIDYTFSTFHAMSAYRSLLLWAATQNEDDPSRNDILGVVREGMVAVVRDSGAGLPLAGWSGAGQPISVMYAGSLPRYAQGLDFNEPSTLAWTTSDQKKLVTPGTVGQSLAAKALLILADRSDEGRGANSVIFFSLIKELEILADHFFLQEKGEMGAVANGAYMPLEVRMQGQAEWGVSNKDSALQGQASLLQGLTHTLRLFQRDDLIKGFFVDGKAEGRDLLQWKELARRTLDEVFSFIASRHYALEAGSFVSDYALDSGTGDRIMIVDAIEILRALDAVVNTLPEKDPLRNTAHDYIKAQAEFIKVALEKRKGRMPRGFLLKRKTPLYGLVQEFSNYAAVMSVLLIADKYVDDEAFKELAKTIFREVDKVYWSEKSKVYRAAEGHKVAAFDGHNFSLILDWFGQMRMLLPGLVDFNQRQRDFFQVVIKNGELLQCEGPANGETRLPEDYFANEIPALADRLIEIEPAKRDGEITAFIRDAADQDNDGLPGCSFGGGEFGAAPVIIKQMSVSTPFLTSEAGHDGQVRRNYGF